MTAREEPQKVV
jgi:hypothetical protein